MRISILLLAALGAATGAFAQDSSLNRRQSGLLDPLVQPGIQGADRVIAAGRGSTAASRDISGDYGDQEILVRSDEWDPWSFGVSFGYEYQSNASLSPNDATEDFLFRQSASGRGTFPLTETLYLSAGFQQQLFRYDELDLLDFDRVDGDAGILWALPESWPILGNSVFSLKGTYYRMSEAENFGEELFSNTGVGVGLLRSYAVGRNQTFLVSGTADVSLDASDEEPQRNDYAILGAWQAKLAPRWESNVFVRGTFYDYNAHADWNFIVGASLDWLPNDWCRIGVSSNFSANASDDEAFEYENAGVGANLRFSLRF